MKLNYNSKYNIITINLLAKQETKELNIFLAFDTVLLNKNQN